MSEASAPFVLQATAVAIEGRALLLEGKPGVGKSSLALALIYRGARLIGDDAVALSTGRDAENARLIATPPPNISGLIEVRGVGLARMDIAPPTPVALILSLLGPNDPDPDRLPERAATRTILGCDVPALPFRPGPIAPAERAQQALLLHGLT